MTWKNVRNKTETATTHNTARNTNILYKGVVYLKFLKTLECCAIPDLFLQFSCISATVELSNHNSENISL